MSLIYTGLRALAVPTLHAFWRLRVTGRENVPKTGPVILAANHLSVSDHLFLPVACPRLVFFMAKSDYFLQGGLKGRFRGVFMRSVGQIPIERSGGRAALAGLEQARKVIMDGNVFGIFPEGTRSPDGRLYRGKTGVTRLALMTGAPVVPVGLVGTNHVQPIGTAFPHPGGTVTVRIGEPVFYGHAETIGHNAKKLREITDDIMGRIAKLSGQEIMDVYATRSGEQTPDA
ncbi:1-acyl-sn-glycerol-3-phosphate acyltransferase [Mangrovihabitans endophyticus]|uniref:1-acyl-sn-glycerol-3-phosphate acyltransferase n=1 Tax=Mangrovihabitans endophyticus TaxID=1751298 RepID=A0A8J3BZJ3_9ACTN|nr:lysophospholipid acyltransferase family protein [Mangrovihabitans endophyticus]GGK86627.1 1-acyl-sn-glycerol-3-phosphate acyltransferase [Mangrovihabitans endophyticus]